LKKVAWYFDYVSPFAYLQSAALDRFERLAEIEPKPVLFAALLNHCGQKGPAEIPSKKVHTFRQVVWLADRHRIPLKLPAAHPFNPLPLLRLSIALGSDADVVRSLFRYIWAEGHLPTDGQAWAKLCAGLGVDEPDAEIARADVKETLRRNTEEAIALGVFGVPTLAVGDRLFWGFDMTDAAVAYLRDDRIYASAQMRRAAELPDGIHRIPR
jgi:2-hydroxychromene-2-carboxylate isomerase